MGLYQINGHYQISEGQVLFSGKVFIAPTSQGFSGYLVEEGPSKTRRMQVLGYAFKFGDREIIELFRYRPNGNNLNLVPDACLISSLGRLERESTEPDLFMGEYDGGLFKIPKIPLTDVIRAESSRVLDDLIAALSEKSTKFWPMQLNISR